MSAKLSSTNCPMLMPELTIRKEWKCVCARSTSDIMISPNRNAPRKGLCICGCRDEIGSRQYGNFVQCSAVRKGINQIARLQGEKRQEKDKDKC